MPDYKTHLDRLMAEHGIENHQLAKAANTGRQSIWKLRNGDTRMLPHWAKRLAPHLHCNWQELIDGPMNPVEAAERDLLAGFWSADQQGQEMVKRLVDSVRRDDPPPAPPPNPTPPRPKGPSPPHPRLGGRAQERRASDRPPRDNGASRRAGD